MYSSFKRFRVEFSELIQSTVPTIKVLLEVDKVNGNLLNELQIELALVQFQFVVRQFIEFIIFEYLRQETPLLVSLFLYYLKDNFTNLIYELICVFTIIFL